jgi:hypothetical protein
MRFQVGIIGGSFLTIVGLYLPWASTYGVSFSGFSIHSFLWLAFLMLLAVFALSILDLFIPTLSEGWPFQTVLVGVVLFAALLTLIAAVDVPTGFGWNIGQVWTLIAVAGTSIAALSPLVSAFQFLRIPVSTTKIGVGAAHNVVGTSFPAESGLPRRFCSACGSPMEADEQFCSSCARPAQ